MSNPQVSIRKATTNDISQIIAWLAGELHAQARNSVANDAILASFEGAHYNDQTLVVVDAAGTRVLAFACWAVNQIELFSVRSELRRQGYGKKLAERVVDEIRQSDTPWTRVLLECKPVSSVPFWASLGFTQVPGRRSGILMQLDLRLNR